MSKRKFTAFSIFRVKGYGIRPHTPQEKFLAAMGEYFCEKMERDDRKKVCFINPHGGYSNLPPHCVIHCSPKLAARHIDGFPENILCEYGNIGNLLRINIHFLGKTDGEMFYAHIGVSRGRRYPLVLVGEAPSDNECFPHIIRTLMIPLRNLEELAESDVAIRNYAREQLTTPACKG